MFSIYDYTGELTELIRNGSDTDDLIHELADQAVPIYNSDIISDWSERPDYWDRFAEEMGEPHGPIIQQMAGDLYMAYRDELTAYVEELTDELGI